MGIKLNFNLIYRNMSDNLKNFIIFVKEKNNHKDIDPCDEEE